jgi:endonuclease/exonuclease/phosphatase family metal-dependent hydrolase
MRNILWALAAAAGLLLQGCGGTNGSSAGDKDTLVLKVISYNIRVGAGPAERLKGDALRQNLTDIGQYLALQEPDFVLLQEVDNGAQRSERLDEAALLAEQLGFHHYFSSALTFDSGGDYGTAILSRWPLSDTQTIKLYQEGDSEQRVLSHVVADAPGGPILVLNAHLGLTETQRTRQLEEVAAHVTQYLGEMPIIFGGDLNALPREQSLASVRYLLNDAYNAQEPLRAKERFTFPALEPDRTIDYLFLSPGFQVMQTRVLPATLSDHRALATLVRLERD